MVRAIAVLVLALTPLADAQTRVTLPKGVRSVSFGTAHRYFGPGKEMCVIVLPLPGAAFERGTTELSYAVELEPRTVKKASAQVVGTTPQQLRSVACNVFTPVPGGFSQTQIGNTMSRIDKAPLASGQYTLRITGRWPDRRRTVPCQIVPAFCFSISTTRFSTTAAWCTSAGARRAQVTRTSSLRSTRRLLSMPSERRRGGSGTMPSAIAQDVSQLDAARREVVRLALVDLGIERRIRLPTRIGDAYSHRRDTGMAPLPDAIETVRWLRESGLRLALLTNGAGPAQRKKIVRFGLAESVRRHPRRGRAGVRQAGRARLPPRADRAAALCRLTPGWSATTSSGMSRRRRNSAFPVSGLTSVAAGCPEHGNGPARLHRAGAFAELRVLLISGSLR